MSLAAIGKVYELARPLDLTSPEINVLVALASFAQEDDVAGCKKSTLVENLNLSDDRIRAITQDLEGRGILTRGVKECDGFRYKQAPGRSFNYYVLHLDQWLDHFNNGAATPLDPKEGPPLDPKEGPPLDPKEGPPLDPKGSYIEERKLEPELEPKSGDLALVEGYPSITGQDNRARGKQLAALAAALVNAPPPTSKNTAQAVNALKGSSLESSLLEAALRAALTGADPRTGERMGPGWDEPSGEFPGWGAVITAAVESGSYGRVIQNVAKAAQRLNTGKGRKRQVLTDDAAHEAAAALAEAMA